MEKQSTITTPKTASSPGTGVDFSEEAINSVDDMHANDEDVYDEIWELYEEDEL